MNECMRGFKWILVLAGIIVIGVLANSCSTKHTTLDHNITVNSNVPKANVNIDVIVKINGSRTETVTVNEQKEVTGSVDPSGLRSLFDGLL